MSDIISYVALSLSLVSIGLSITFYFLLKNRIDKANLDINGVAVDLNKVSVDDDKKTWDGV